MFSRCLILALVFLGAMVPGKARGEGGPAETYFLCLEVVEACAFFKEVCEEIHKGLVCKEEAKKLSDLEKQIQDLLNTQCQKDEHFCKNKRPFNEAQCREVGGLTQLMCNELGHGNVCASIQKAIDTELKILAWLEHRDLQLFCLGAGEGLCKCTYECSLSPYESVTVDENGGKVKDCNAFLSKPGASKACTDKYGSFDSSLREVPLGCAWSPHVTGGISVGWVNDPSAGANGSGSGGKSGGN